jgi:GH24 family phage-related lysozyme (muramidase)
MASSLTDIFDSQPAVEERQVLGVSKQEQGKPEDAMKDAEKAQGEAMSVTDYIKGNESFRADIYEDTTGHRTVGHGLNLDDEVTRGMVPSDVVSGKRPITREESRAITQLRIDLAIKDAARYMGGEQNFVNLSNSQKKAIIDMSYNLGLTKLNKFVDLRKALFEGNKLKAKEEVLDSKYAREDVPNRARKNANLMLK